jgi:hypothetical protein
LSCTSAQLEDAVDLLVQALPTTSRGVPAGANIANQARGLEAGQALSRPPWARPVPAGERFAAGLRRRARIFPSLAIGSAEGMLSNMSWICPPSEVGDGELPALVGHVRHRSCRSST